MVRMLLQDNKKPFSRIDPCGICGRNTMANEVLHKTCENWIHGRCAKIKRVTSGSTIYYKGDKWTYDILQV